MHDRTPVVTMVGSLNSFLAYDESWTGTRPCPRFPR